MINQYLGFVNEISHTMDQKPIDMLVAELGQLQKRKGRLFLLGVGGSAANASHAVNDFRKLCGIEAYAPTDNVAELTARINDDGWKNCFSDWLQASNLSSNDMIFILSVGGGREHVSVNLVWAIRYAKKVGAKVVGIVGRDGGYTKKHADVCVVIPTVNQHLITPFVESFQIILLHFFAFHPYLNRRRGKWT